MFPRLTLVDNLPILPIYLISSPHIFTENDALFISSFTLSIDLTQIIPEDPLFFVISIGSTSLMNPATTIAGITIVISFFLSIVADKEGINNEKQNSEANMIEAIFFMRG